jgi:hypothetical protein
MVRQRVIKGGKIQGINDESWKLQSGGIKIEKTVGKKSPRSMRLDRTRYVLHSREIKGVARTRGEKSD